MLQEVTPESNISILAIAGDSTNLEYHLVSIPWEGLSASEVLPTSLVFKFVLNLDVNIKHELENMINSQDQGHVMGINCCDKMDLASSLFDNEPIPYKLSSSS